MNNTGTKNKIEWKKIGISDREVFENTGENAEGIAMFSFASMFFWKDFYHTSYSIINGNIVMRGCSDGCDDVVYFPRGLQNDVKDTVEQIINSEGNTICFMPLTERTAETIKEVYPFSKISLIDGKCEYVYNQSDLATLSGKKYHSKRNHIAKFDKNYTYEYIEINEEKIPLLRECAKHLFEKIENSPVDEFTAINTAIDNFVQLKLRSGVITVDGNYVAYSIGSSVNKDVADIHFEKADRSYEGSYAKINNCFAANAFADKKYLNREEDLGIEGLRKAKLSYYPSHLNQMYKIELF